jgi:hypothetical protein
MNEQGFYDLYKVLAETKTAKSGDYPQLSLDMIDEIEEMLLDMDITAAAKEKAILLLAHQQSKTAIRALKRYILKTEDPDLKIFAQIGLDECRMWNEP